MPAPKSIIDDIINGEVSNGRQRPRDNHFRTDDDEYEYIARLALNSTIAGLIRRFFFGRGWRDSLEKLREKHRAAGIPDTDFYHPGRLKEMGHRTTRTRARK